MEQAAANFACEQPAYGQLWVRTGLKKQGIPVSPGGVRGIRLRHDGAAFKGRLRALEVKTAQERPKAGIPLLNGSETEVSEQV